MTLTTPLTQTPTKNSFYQLIEKIQKRPAMYLGSCSLSRLEAFLGGYFVAKQELALSLTPEEEHFSKFQVWIQEKFQTESSQSWAKIILFHTTDEAQALDSFFKLWHEFEQRSENKLRSKNDRF